MATLDMYVSQIFAIIVRNGFRISLASILIDCRKAV